MTEGAFVEMGHLGGYRAGGDDATFYPELWRFLVAAFGDRVLDVGCGDGQASDYFTILGARVVGVDGVPQRHERIVEHDFTTGPWQPPPIQWTVATGPEFDFVWSCEFVEHVEERYVPNFLAAFAFAPRVFMTHAGVGQGGYHHVNCRSADYWIGALAAVGFRLDEVLTAQTRTLAARNPSPHNHYARAGLAFVRPPA